MMTLFLKFFGVFCAAQAAVDLTSGACDLRLVDQPKWMPLIWNNNKSLIYPMQDFDSKMWGFMIGNDESVHIGCAPASTNYLQNFKLEETQVQCLKNNALIGPNGNTSFQELDCAGAVKERVVSVKTDEEQISSVGLEHIQIQHETSSIQFPLINLCFDRRNGATIVATHTIHGSSLNPYEVSNNRPSFKSGEFYPQFSVATAYTQSEQLKTMTALTGSDALASKYIDVSKSLYFARGHLAPDGDFVHVFEQNATYYYINVVPQWQTINNGNWKALEISIRNYAIQRSVDLRIWTGTYGILQLHDINQNPVEIFLGKDPTGKKFLPVPKLTIKVIHDVARNTGVAVLVLNNPHMTKLNAGDIICPDICYQITWITGNKTDFRKGYTYCCEISEVKRVWPHIPDFGKLSILT